MLPSRGSNFYLCTKFYVAIQLVFITLNTDLNYYTCNIHYTYLYIRTVKYEHQFYLLQLAGGILTDNYKFSEPAEKQRAGRFRGGNIAFWEEKYVHACMHACNVMRLIAKLCSYIASNLAITCINYAVMYKVTVCTIE